MLRVFALLSVLLVLCNAENIREISFKQLEDEKGQKIVVFYDSKEASQDALSVLKEIKDDPKLASWEAVKVDAEAESNKESVENAKFTKFPQVFTNSADGGVEQWSGEFTKQKVDDWFNFKTMTVADDRVKRLEKLKKDVNKMVKSKKPMFVKLYEEWCPHCKRIKKDFQVASAEIKDWNWLEVECSKADLNTKFCQHMGTTGYPTLYVVNKGKKMKYTGGRKLADFKEFTSSFDVDSFEWEPFGEFTHNVEGGSSNTNTKSASSNKSPNDILEELEAKETLILKGGTAGVEKLEKRLDALDEKLEQILDLLRNGPEVKEEL